MLRGYYNQPAGPANRPSETLSFLSKRRVMGELREMFDDLSDAELVAMRTQLRDAVIAVASGKQTAEVRYGDTWRALFCPLLGSPVGADGSRDARTPS